jgi:hypothetical protein
MVRPGRSGDRPDQRTSILRRAIVQGKPVVRRGRKARDLPVTEDRPATENRRDLIDSKESDVKTNLRRFTWAVTLLASMALSIGAGMRWS